MRTKITQLPESISELCLVRIGLQANGLRGCLYLGGLGRAIDRAAAEAHRAKTGLLHHERFRPSWSHLVCLQYWSSFAELEAWSHGAPHTGWWREAAERMRGRGDVGVYHETFLIARDKIEAIASNCRPAGLAAFGVATEPSGSNATARGRLGFSRPS